jgi:hypothetical protein
VASLAPPYTPRRPTETVLYRVVRETLDTFVAHARETYERPLPRYVENELRAYLRCGVFSFGFIRCHCDTCGHAMQRGTFAPLPNTEPPGASADPPRSHAAVDHEGWNLHAGVHIATGDDQGRERLLRYGARPALALDRLRRLADGRIAFRVKYSRGRSKHRVMMPLEFMARLAAFIPPPRFPLVRFHGVLGPRSSWRKDVVPRPRGTVPCPRNETKERDPRRTRRGRGDDGAAARPGHAKNDARDVVAPPVTVAFGTAAPIAPSPSPSPERVRVETTGVVPPQPLPSTAPTLLAPNVLSIAHWNRIAGGELYAATPRMAWAPLLRRTFAVDVQECPKCHGRLRLIAAIVDPPVARAILTSLGMPTSAPVTARARDPTDLFEPDAGEMYAP